MGVRAVLVVLLLVTAGCRQLLGLDDLPPRDASTDTFVPDAGPCQSLGPTCAGPNTLRTCTMLDSQPVDTSCAWGCTGIGGPHCAKLAPSGGGVTPADLDPNQGLLPITISTSVVVDDTGAITGIRGAGLGLQSGIDFHIANGIAIYDFDSLTITGVTVVTLSGTHPLAFVARGDLALDSTAVILATGTCANQMTPGPGGGAGGDRAMPGMGAGAAEGGVSSGGGSSGGGGGGNGAIGGVGGKPPATAINPAGGAAIGNATVSVLVGGGGGGGGGGSTGGQGGGGGGAIQLVSNGTLVIAGVITSGGCGARHGQNAGNGAGGGGGAGGTILLEAYAIVLNGMLAVNGGGGGGGAGGTNGAIGPPNLTTALGGIGGGGGAGGNGGASLAIAGQPGTDDTVACGGGGGGAGRIRIETVTGQVTGAGKTSPTLAENPTTSTLGVAPTQ